MHASIEQARRAQRAVVEARTQEQQIKLSWSLRASLFDVVVAWSRQELNEGEVREARFLTTLENVS